MLKHIEKISPSDKPEGFGEQVQPQQEKQLPSTSFELSSYSEEEPPPEYEQGPYKNERTRRYRRTRSIKKIYMVYPFLLVFLKIKKK